MSNKSKLFLIASLALVAVVALLIGFSGPASITAVVLQQPLQETKISNAELMIEKQQKEKKALKEKRALNFWCFYTSKSILVQHVEAFAALLTINAPSPWEDEYQQYLFKMETTFEGAEIIYADILCFPKRNLNLQQAFMLMTLEDELATAIEQAESEIAKLKRQVPNPNLVAPQSITK